MDETRRWDFVGRVLRVEEARKLGHQPQSNLPGVGRRRSRRPGRGRRLPHAGVTSRSSEAGERAQGSRGVTELEAQGLAEAHVAVDMGGQHDDTSGQGCAISTSRPKSTLA
jgi:hypothetical protein